MHIKSISLWWTMEYTCCSERWFDRYRLLVGRGQCLTSVWSLRTLRIHDLKFDKGQITSAKSNYSNTSFTFHIVWIEWMNNIVKKRIGNSIVMIRMQSLENSNNVIMQRIVVMEKMKKIASYSQWSYNVDYPLLKGRFRWFTWGNCRFTLGIG